MPRALRIGLPLTVAALVGGCGGSPLYSEQQVPTMSASAPSPPSEPMTSSAPTQPSTTSSPPKPSNSPPQSSSRTPKSSTAPPSAADSTPPSQGTPTPPDRTSDPTPRSTEPAPTTTTSQRRSTPPQADPTTLDTLGGPGSGPVGIAGTRHPHSFAVSACTIFSEQPEYDFPLDGRFARLTGVVGQDDASTARDARLRLKVIGDGRVLADHTVRYGQQVPVSVDVTGIGTLTLDFSEVSCGSDGAALAFGRAEVS